MQTVTASIQRPDVGWRKNTKGQISFLHQSIKPSHKNLMCWVDGHGWFQIFTILIVRAGYTTLGYIGILWLTTSGNVHLDLRKEVSCS